MWGRGDIFNFWELLFILLLKKNNQQPVLVSWIKYHTLCLRGNSAGSHINVQRRAQRPTAWYAAVHTVLPLSPWIWTRLSSVLGLSGLVDPEDTFLISCQAGGISTWTVGVEADVGAFLSSIAFLVAGTSLSGALTLLCGASCLPVAPASLPPAAGL